MSLLVLAACQGTNPDTGDTGDTGDTDPVDCTEITESTVDADIDAATTWAGAESCQTYLVTTDIDVSAALTIEPGAHVMFAQGVRLQVVPGGSLSAVGTAAAPILLDGVNHSAGYWDGIRIQSVDAANELTWVQVNDGGDGGWANVYIEESGGIVVTHSTFGNSGTVGLNAQEGADLSGFASNTFQGNTEAALSIGPEHMGALDEDSVYLGDSSPNGNQWIAVRTGTLITDQTWAATDAPFHFGGDVGIEAAVNVEAGAHFLVGQGVRLEVRSGGSLRAEGTNSARITFAGETPSAGFWDGIRVQSTSNDNILDHVDIAHGGDGGWANLYVESTGSVALADSTFSNGEGPGVELEDGAMVMGFSNNTFTDNTGPALQIAVQHMGGLDASSTYTPNSDDFIAVGGGSTLQDATWPATDAPFHFDSNAAVEDAVIVQPGAWFQGGPGARLEIKANGSLYAVGTSTNDIVFEGEESIAGYWDGIRYQSASTDNQLAFATLSDGGDGGWANLYVESSGYLSLTDCTVTNSGTYGLVVKSGGVIDPATEGAITSENTFSGNSDGAVDLQ